MKYLGCKEICDITHTLYSKGFCQYFSNYMLESASVSSNLTSPENLNWFLIYDPQHIDSSATIILSKLIYGIFKFNSGFYRYFKRIQSSYPNYQIGLKIKIVTFNEIPINCGIQFMINNTIFGSIYRSASGIQTNKLIIYNIELESVYLTYSSNKKYDLITYVDIPRYPFLFSATGNYTDDTAGWAIASIQVTTGYCHEDCTQCEVSFKCKQCYYGYYFYRDGSCISNCQSPYQKLNGSYCQDYDDETPYSYYLIKEYINAANDPGQYSQYTLISQNGINFLKGSDIYYSYIQGIRVFGGPFVWAQAKFQRVHNIISPHHSVTIAFYILYGPSFPSDGNFIYTIENNTPVSKSSVDSSLNYDGSKYYKVYEKIIHNSNTLTITWECLGPNNEPIKAYCGFYNYYIAVHDCKPYCLQCSDQTTCTLWNSTYDASIVRFSQSECLVNQYYDKDSIRCLDCPLSCLTCTSTIDCQTCQPTYVQTKLGCICKMNQYEESNQCFDCPIECNQCLSSTYCIECLNSNFRQLSNGQCNCFDGFYPIVSNPQCQICHQFCKTCIGPTSEQCLTCNDIVNIEKVGSTCRCPTGSSYQEEIKTCSSCHPSCLSCFRTTIDGCLTCDLSLNRILKGLKCVCAPGYYELSNICTNCPNSEDTSLSQCYKQCNNNQQIWHTNTCTSCDSGFNLVYGECQPICGDSQIKGYEQCEDNNTILDDKCYNCQFQCPTHCLTCDQSTTLPCPDICGDGIITGNEECEDGNNIQYDGCFNCKYQCQTSCTKCIQGKCFECATAGWYIDPTVTPWQCKERCYDLQIVGSEQCDDGNLSDTDGCKDCKYFCRIGCSSCDYTNKKCLSCEFPGFAPTSYYCKNTCGDGLVVTDPYGFYSEECDDGNTINGDGCSSSCYFQCQSSTICTSCVSNRCEICATGYILSSQKVCLPICGDSMIVVGEQCENSYILPYKGCINCQARCQSSCLTCDTTGLGCISCKNGYNRIDNLCYSICGDTIITEDEECDDGNLLIGDGCHFCQFTCQDQCLNCIKGICYDCQEGYELIQSKCYLILQKNQLFINQGETKYQLISLNQNCDINCMNCQDGICDLCSQGNYLFHNECISNHITKIFYVNDNINLCGDNKIMDDEECEDNNIIPFDGCYYCKFQCDINCNDCQFGKCQGCILGYILNTNFICEPECGDGIVILYSNEQCDLDIEWCINCQFKCQPNCSKCNLQECFQCQEGFYPYLTSCIPICGDGIVIDEYEDCDDQNDQPNDGCFECQFDCSKNCKICEKTKCQQCDIDYVLKNNQCLLIKQKDDINSNIIDKPQNNDTINNSVNPQWLSLNENKICREYECVYSKKPSMKLTFKKRIVIQYKHRLLRLKELQHHNQLNLRYII
ncbi:unnamed protein product [Paramecium primaurelia]|uniref:EGF-like domain-containing protein n=1 Tax=Paramecium primaurelia TaxID=5886 RepID=A0A8S1KG24_PARPR|nr:unnamed protein product [Paramecium primaurelia]